MSYQDIAPLRIPHWLFEPAETLLVDSWLSELTRSKAGVVAEHVKPKKGASAKKAKIDAERDKARIDKLASLSK